MIKRVTGWIGFLLGRAEVLKALNSADGIDFSRCMHIHVSMPHATRPCMQSAPSPRNSPTNFTTVSIISTTSNYFGFKIQVQQELGYNFMVIQFHHLSLLENGAISDILRCVDYIPLGVE
jgi:hypothetical protein